jgi:hypothetical protein
LRLQCVSNIGFEAAAEKNGRLGWVARGVLSLSVAQQSLGGAVERTDPSRGGSAGSLVKDLDRALAFQQRKLVQTC